MRRVLFFIFVTVYALIIGSFAQTPDSPHSRALASMSKGEFNTAIKILDEAIEGNRQSFELYKLRSELKRMVGNFADSLEDLNTAIDLKSDDGELFERRATLRLYQRQDPKLILSDLDSAISLGRKFEKVYTSRGRIRMMLGDKAGATSDYEAAIALKPDSPAPYLGLSTVYKLKQDEERSRTILENFLLMIENSGKKIPSAKGEVTATTSNIVPPFAEGVVVLEGAQIITRKSTSGTEGNSKMPVPSREDLEKGAERLEWSKNVAAVYGALAEIYFTKKELEKAASFIDSGFRIDPYSFPLYLTKGQIRAELGDYDGAIKSFNEVIKMMPNVPPVYIERGIAYLMLGHKADAKIDFDTYLQMFPSGKVQLDKRIAEANLKLERDKK